MVGFEDKVTGSHSLFKFKLIECLMSNLSEYDMIVLQEVCLVLPLRDNEQLITELKFEKIGKKVAAICAAPIALNQAGLLEGRNFTCYDRSNKLLTVTTIRNSSGWECYH